MTAYTVTEAVNIDALTGKTGGDTYAINGGTLVIDQDSRYGANATTSASLGSITVSATLGGAVEIDGRYVRLIPFTSNGATNVPTAGSVISQGGVSGKLIGVWTAINAAPLAAGAAMPASGFLKVKQVSQIPGYSAGALTLSGSTWNGTVASGADTSGWIEIVGDEASTATIPRLGTFRARGEWFEIGATSGSRATTYQLPTNGNACYCAGVWVEKASGGDYEFYPNVGSLIASASIATDAVRGKVCWIGTAGVLRFGHDGTNSDTGYLPVSGLKVRIPNVFLQNCTTAARTANALPNVTLATRYDFTTTSGGDVSFDTVASAWAMAFTSPWVLSLNHVAVCDQLLVASVLSASTWADVGVGMSGSLSTIALQIDTSYAGVTLTDCVFARYSTAGQNAVQIQTSNNVSLTRVRAFSLAMRTSSNAVTLYFNGCTGVDLESCVVGGATIQFVSCVDVRAKNTVYFDRIAGTTNSTNAVSLFKLSGTRKVVVDGVSFGGLSNVNQYAQLLQIAGTLDDDIVLRNVGTPASPLSLGPTVPGKFFSIYNVNTNIAFQRVYLCNVATGPDSGSVSVQGVTLQNVFLDYTTSVAVTCRDFTAKGLRAASLSSVGSNFVGNIFGDIFTSDTTGAIRFMTNEPSTLNAAYVTLANGARFTGSSNGLYMPEIGMSAMWEMPYYALGHTALTGVTLTDANNFFVEFQVDVGTGFSAWQEATSDNLSTVEIDPSFGVKLRLRITTTTTNTTALATISVTTATTLDAQAYQYPLEVATVSVDGLAIGSMVKASKVSDGTVVFAGQESGGVVTFTTEYAGALAIEARKASSPPYYRPWQSQVTTALGATVSATAVQQLDE